MPERPHQGDIVLVPIPFTDLTSSRRRPVIVISNDTYHRRTADMLVVAMTSNPQPVDYSFTLTSSDLVGGSLNRPGKVRVDRVYTLAQSIAVRRFGRVGVPALQRIREMLDDLTSLPADL